jgi:hypothetical protein
MDIPVVSLVGVNGADGNSLVSLPSTPVCIQHTGRHMIYMSCNMSMTWHGVSVHSYNSNDWH